MYCIAGKFIYVLATKVDDACIHTYMHTLNAGSDNLHCSGTTLKTGLVHTIVISYIAKEIS